MNARVRQRLAALHEYRLLDVPADGELAAVGHVPYATRDPDRPQDPCVTGHLEKVRFHASVPLVTPHGGRIHADAREGGGTVVTMTLPGA